MTRNLMRRSTRYFNETIHLFVLSQLTLSCLLANQSSRKHKCLSRGMHSRNIDRAQGNQDFIYAKMPSNSQWPLGRVVGGTNSAATGLTRQGDTHWVDGGTGCLICTIGSSRRVLMKATCRGFSSDPRWAVLRWDWWRISGRIIDYSSLYVPSAEMPDVCLQYPEWCMANTDSEFWGQQVIYL